jgi:hypothetical protein
MKPTRVGRQLLPLILLLSACSAKQAYEASYDYAAPPQPASGGVGGLGGIGTLGRGGGAPPPPSAPAPSAAYDAAPASTPPGGSANGAAQSPAEPAAARMVHYQGSARLRVSRTQEAIDSVIALATKAGGGLEQQYGDTVVLRVPVAAFEETFAAILGVGDVVAKAISAEDVTEAFMSVDLRLRTAAARRDRLVTLLGRAKTEAEKLALVREIQEVTEEIDKLEQQVRTLRRLADFSRITVQVEQRPALTWQGGAPESAAFDWIRALSPFGAGASGKQLALDTPEGFVAIDIKKRFVAESADGARIWSTRLVNDPEGDAPFWTEAVEQRMKSEFADARRETSGAWQGIRLLDRSAAPYVWYVLVRANGKDLDVVQIFYPSTAAEERYAPAVRAVLAGGGAS